MKSLVLLLVIVLSTSLTAAEKLIKLNLSYPQTGTAIGGQIGLILEKTDILKIHGFTSDIKRTKTIKELQTVIVEKSADVVITTEMSYVELADKNANVTVFSTLGTEGNRQLVNVVNKAFSAKNPTATEKLNSAFVDAFYYLINHKAQVNKWYSDLAKLTPDAVDAASLTNKNYKAKNLGEINIKIQ